MSGGKRSPVPAGERKRRSRERMRQLGIKVIEVRLSPPVQRQLDEARHVRGGIRGPYSVDEYIDTLIREDCARLERQIAKLGSCRKCGSALPEGCGGLFKGDGDCFHTRRALELRLNVTGHTE